MNTIATHYTEKKKRSSFSFTKKVNNWIKEVEVNAFGLSAGYLIIGTAIASIVVALAAAMKIFALIFISGILVTLTNSMILSQRTFKVMTWFFLITAGINSLFLIFLLWINFA